MMSDSSNEREDVARRALERGVQASEPREMARPSLSVFPCNGPIGLAPGGRSCHGTDANEERQEDSPRSRSRSDGCGGGGRLPPARATALASTPPHPSPLPPPPHAASPPT